jgi:excisionase family DNA binding protein
LKNFEDVNRIVEKGEHEILGAREVAAYLQLHLFTVHKLAREGRLPAFKVGRDWRFRRSSIEDWIQQEETQRRRR